MGNPLFNELNKQTQTQNQGDDIVNFMNQVRGMSPRDLINRAVSSGCVNQEQLNIIQQKAQQSARMFDKFKGMFGF